MKKVVGLLKEAGVEQRSRVKEAVQTALQDGSLQASVELRHQPHHARPPSARCLPPALPASHSSTLARAPPNRNPDPSPDPNPDPATGRVRRQGEERQDPAARAGEA